MSRFSRSLMLMFILLLPINAFAESFDKIAIITPTLSRGEDEFRGAEKLKKKYLNRIIHIVLPENYSEEQETAITQILSLAENPKVKAIIISAGYTGMLPAFQKVKEKRPDIFVVAAPLWDDPYLVAKYVDLSLDVDWVKRGTSIPEKAKQMGAKTFIHYSFPSHMATEVISQRYARMKETAEKLGMTFVTVSAPDPTLGMGANPLLQFLLEDIPQQIDKYGKDTAIFGTNCLMQDIIISQAVELKYIMPEQCCPTPTQGFPAGMDLAVDKKDLGDFKKLNELISQKAKETGMTGRLSTWPVSVGYLVPELAVELAIAKMEGKIKKVTIKNMTPIAEKLTGGKVFFEQLSPKIDNSFLIFLESIYY